MVWAPGSRSLERLPWRCSPICRAEESGGPVRPWTKFIWYCCSWLFLRWWCSRTYLHDGVLELSEADHEYWRHTRCGQLFLPRVFFWILRTRQNFAGIPISDSSKMILHTLEHNFKQCRAFHDWMNKFDEDKYDQEFINIVSDLSTQNCTYHML